MTTLDKIRAEIKDCLWKLSEGNTYLDITREEVENAILDIIDKYAEQSGWEEMTVSCKHCGKDMTFKIATIGEPCEGCKYKSMAEQEPCDDAISREAVVDDFIEWREKLEYTVGEDYSGVHLLNVAIQKIWDMPSVTPKPTECGDVVSRQGCKVIEPYEAEVITRGNCMMCGKELTEGLFLCKECGEKARINELDK